MSVYRTFLFAPGNHARRVEKALSLDADAVILDLEDAVAIAEKPATRKLVVDALQRSRTGLGYIRVNAISTEFCHGDIDAVVARGVDGIVLPKVEAAHELKTIDWLVGELERARGLPRGGIDIIPIIETARGMQAAYEIAAAGIEPPLDTVWIELKDTDGFKASALRCRQLGYQGKMCIYPDQVGVVNAIFTPSVEDIARAKKFVAAFAEAERTGLASIQVDGRFIDYPIVYRAQRILATVAKIEGRKR